MTIHWLHEIYITEYHCYSFFFLAVLGFELRAWCLLGWCLSLQPSPQPFHALVIFQIGFLNFDPGLASDLDPSNYSF
jgi:hypothetical protein